MTDFEGLSVEVEPYEEIVEGLRYSRPEGIADHRVPIQKRLIK